jgi:hypothetical protein
MATKPISVKKASKKKKTPKRLPVPIAECLEELGKTKLLIDGEEFYAIKHVARALADMRGVSEVDSKTVLKFLGHYFHFSGDGAMNRRWSLYSLPASSVEGLAKTGIPWDLAVVVMREFPQWFRGYLQEVRQCNGSSGGKVSGAIRTAEAEERKKLEEKKRAKKERGNQTTINNPAGKKTAEGNKYVPKKGITKTPPSAGKAISKSRKKS